MEEISAFFTNWWNFYCLENSLWLIFAIICKILQVVSCNNSNSNSPHHAKLCSGCYDPSLMVHRFSLIASLLIKLQNSKPCTPPMPFTSKFSPTDLRSRNIIDVYASSLSYILLLLCTQYTLGMLPMHWIRHPRKSKIPIALYTFLAT